MQVKIFKGFENYSKAFEEKKTKDVSGTVQEILANVRNNGDAALREYTERFDKVVPESWLVPKSALDEAFEDESEPPPQDIKAKDPEINKNDISIFFIKFLLNITLSHIKLSYSSC